MSAKLRALFSAVMVVATILHASDVLVVCPSGCVCNNMTVDDQRDEFELGVGIDCRGVFPNRTNVKEILNDFDQIPENVLQLDLSNNNIELVDEASFVAFPALTRLSLKMNLIRIIEADAFRNLSELIELDLSDNELTWLNSSVFNGLSKLNSLSLAGNKLSELNQVVFHALPSLRTLDVSSNELRCDCDLKWIVRWARLRSINFAPQSVCYRPSKLQGRPIKSLKKKELHCNWPVQIPVFEMKPTINQIVFRGDQLKLGCSLFFVDKTASLSWLHNWQSVTNLSNYAMEEKQAPDGSGFMTSIFLNPLVDEHEGSWTCLAKMKRGNKNHTLEITVISEDTKYCPQTVTNNNKGRLIWPKAVAGIQVELPCEGHVTNTGYKPSQAYFKCNLNGQWENLNTSQCAYVSEVTKVLQQFSTTNLSISSKASIGESVARLRNYTGDGSMLVDSMDIVFIARTVENYLEFVPRQKEIGEVLIDVVNTVMRVDESLLTEAQVQDRSCTRLIQVVEKIPELVADGEFNRHRDNIAVGEFIIKPKSFSGMICTSYIGLRATNEYPYNEKLFKCNNVDVSTKIPLENQVIEASIELPASLFEFVDRQQSSSGSSQTLQFALYRSSKLFPVVNDKENKVTTSVISSQLVNNHLVNLSEPVTIQLRVHHLTDDLIPVWWDFEANDEYGDWSSVGCSSPHHSRFDDHLIIFQCNRLANFGILQNTNQILLVQTRRQGAKFRLSHPVVYVGNAICIFCLIIVILVYLSFARFIKMPKKMKHSLVNTWLAMSLLCFFFSIGVYQTENWRLCQAVGLLLHYLTLCVLLWMTVTVSNMYKKLTKSETTSDVVSRDEPPLPPKPMLRFYLVAWGVPIIICGISGAINMEEYAGYAYCFLAFGPSLGAFYGPVGVLVFNLCTFFCLIHCVLNSTAYSTTNLSSDAPAVELISAVDQPSIEVRSTTSSNANDSEHPPVIQLRAHAVVLLLFLLMWASAAMATAHPFANQILHDEVIFSCVYSVVSVSQGCFILVFFCLSRRDVRMCWKRLGQCHRWSNVYAARSLATPIATANGHVRQSTNSLASNLTNKSSHTSRSVESSASKNGPRLTTRNSAPTFDAYPNTYSHGSSHTRIDLQPSAVDPEIFYNARQNGIAKRFFEKNRQQQMKMARRHSKAKTDGDLSSGDYNTVPRENDKRHRRDRKHCTSLLTTNLNGDTNSSSQQFNSVVDDKCVLVKSEQANENTTCDSIQTVNTNDQNINCVCQVDQANSSLPIEIKNWDSTHNESNVEPNYAYVNHSYQQKNSTDSANRKLNSLKRSASANEHIPQITSNEQNESNVWIQRQAQESKLKKETSV